MMTDTTIQFREWNQPEVKLQVCGWNPKGLLFVLEPDGVQRVFRLLPMMSDFPDVAPVEITEVRLLPPPCAANECDAEKLRMTKDGVPYNCPRWELFRLRYDSEVLVPFETDLRALSAALEEFCQARQKEYTERKQELAELQRLADRGHSLVGHARYYADEADMPFLFNQERIKLEMDFPRGCLHWTIDEARRRPSIRNRILYVRWEKTQNVTLQALANQRARFLNTLPPDAVPKDTFLQIFRPNPLLEIMGHPKRYDPMQDIFESSATFGFDWSNENKLDLCAQVRFTVKFANGKLAWLQSCDARPPQNAAERAEFPHVADSDPGIRRMETAAGKVEKAVDKVGAISGQLDATAANIAKTVEPLTRLYPPDSDLADIRKRALGQTVPAEFFDWVISQFYLSNPPRLPTKGEAYDNCGPGTIIGRRLQQADIGTSLPRFAAHLTVIRQLLESKGLIARRSAGKSRKRAGFHDPSQIEDINAPNPSEIAADRDDASPHSFEPSDPQEE
jgi:hypothetical protein